MERVGGIKNFNSFGRVPAAARRRPICDPELLRCRNVDHTVGRHTSWRGHTIAALAGLCLDNAKRSLPSIADVDHAVTDARGGWPNDYFAPASLDLAGFESAHLG